MLYLNLPVDADFLKVGTRGIFHEQQTCLFCVEYLAFHPSKYATLASTEEQTPLEQFCMESFSS